LNLIPKKYSKIPEIISRLEYINEEKINLRINPISLIGKNRAKMNIKTISPNNGLIRILNKEIIKIKDKVFNLLTLNILLCILIF
ncbi:hypothetical protein EBR37_00535, partial [bacterium]|nr:hypothetical protein [bacterium]